MPARWEADLAAINESGLVMTSKSVRPRVSTSVAFPSTDDLADTDARDWGAEKLIIVNHRLNVHMAGDIRARGLIDDLVNNVEPGSRESRLRGATEADLNVIRRRVIGYLVRGIDDVVDIAEPSELLFLLWLSRYTAECLAFGDTKTPLRSWVEQFRSRGVAKVDFLRVYL